MVKTEINSPEKPRASPGISNLSEPMRYAKFLIPLLAMLSTRGDSPAGVLRSVSASIPAPTVASWKDKLHAAYAASRRGDYAAEAATLDGCRDWLRLYPSNVLAARTHDYFGGAYLGLLNYPAALRHLSAARSLYRASGDAAGFAAVSSNLSNLYFTLQALPEALHAADDAMSALALTGNDRQRLRILIHKARLLSRTGDGAGASALFRRAAAEAQQCGDHDAAALSWYLEAVESSLRDDAPAARVTLRRALWLRWTAGDPGIAGVRRLLAMERLKAGHRESAAAFADRARASRNPSTPDWTIPHARAMAHLAAGEERQAVAELRLAVNQLRVFEMDRMPPSLRSAAAERVHGLYGDFISAGNRLYARSPDEALLQETLQAAAADQAFGLRGSSGAGPDAAREGVISDLQSAYTRLFAWPEDRAGLARLRMNLIELEAASIRDAEPRRLSTVARSIAGDEAILVFHLGPAESFLWTIVSSGTQLHRLAPERAITAKVAAFRDAIERRAGAFEAGRALYDSLFGGIDKNVRSKRIWRIVPAGSLYRVPFHALAPPQSAGRRRYLVEDHAVRLVPGLWMYGERQQPAWDGPALAVGDPVYNRADSRFLKPSLAGSASGPELPRLPASGVEIRKFLQIEGGSARAILGTGATPGNVAGALGSRPAVIHFATHVLPSPERAGESLLALSLGRYGEFQHLSPEWIAAREIRASLVVMSACRSGSGEIRPGDGLLGLTRAWIAAGVSTVVATYWPTPDTSGTLLGRFHELRRRLGAGNEELALRDAILELLRTNDWRSQPEYWAGFFVIGRPVFPAGLEGEPQMSSQSPPE